jgi:hypothetical protein
MNLNYKVCCALLLSAAIGWSTASAQTTININEPGERQLLRAPNDAATAERRYGEAVAERVFVPNARLVGFSPNNVGDTLLLDFFDTQPYRAVVTAVAAAAGVTGITARLTDGAAGYCFVSVSPQGVYVSADLPADDLRFVATGRGGEGRLRQYRLSEQKAHELNCIELGDEAASGGRPAAAHADPAEAAGEDAVDEAAEIGVLVVYTPAAEAWAAGNGGIEQVVNQAMLKANLVADNSRTGITFRLVRQQRVAYTEENSQQDLYNLMFTDDGILDEVHTLRRQYEADLVVLIEVMDFAGGIGFVLGSERGRPDLGFSVVRVHQAASGYSMVHEMGHNMGCAHHRLQGANNGLYTYSYGWRGTTLVNNHKYCSIMTYEPGSLFPDGVSHTRIPYFSSPDITFEGVPLGKAGEEDNTLTVRRTKRAVALYSDYFRPALAQLTTDAGMLAPAFDPSVTDYELTTSNERIVFSGTATHSSASVTGLGTHGLNMGMNTFTIMVTSAAEDHPVQTYRLRIVRATVSTDARLQSLSVDGYSLSPAFSADVADYTLNVAYSTDSITIRATPVHAAASVVGAGCRAVAVGSQVFTVTVTAEDGVAQRVYRLHTVRADNPPVVLTSLTLNDGDAVALYRTVRLNFAITGGTPTHFMAGEQPDGSDASWLPYRREALTYTFASDAHGKKTVYGRLKNGQGETAVAEDAIYYKPLHAKLNVASFGINNHSERTGSREVTLHCTIENGTPDVYSVAERRAEAGAVWLPYTVDPPAFTLSEGGGSKEVFFVVANACDTSDVVSDRIYLDESFTMETHGLSAKLFPNPVDNVLQVAVDNKDAAALLQVVVYGLTGEVYLVHTTPAAMLSLDLSHCPDGILLVKLSSESRYVVKRIIKL